MRRQTRTMGATVCRQARGGLQFGIRVPGVVNAMGQTYCELPTGLVANDNNLLLGGLASGGSGLGQLGNPRVDTTAHATVRRKGKEDLVGG